MAVTYTTSALVRKRVKDITAAPTLADADIEANIEMVEGFINSAMKYSFLTTFDATKHAIIRSCATDYAAYLSILYDVAQFSTIEDVETTLNGLWVSWATALCLLSDPRLVEYLKSL